MKRFSNLTDVEVVLLYKQNSDSDLESELISRYKSRAKKLAGELYHKFCFLYQVEYEDIYCIVMASIFVSVKSFKIGMKNFFKYWKNCAVREVYEYASQFSICHVDMSFNANTASNGEERNYYHIMKQCDTNLTEEYPIMSDIVMAIEADKKHFSDIDKDILFLYIEGYNLYEIAVTLNLTYSAVRRRISKIKTKISDILFNQ